MADLAMTKSLMTTLLLGLLLGLLGLWPCRSFSIDFQLQDLQGRSVRLSDYPDRWVVLNFWANWCPPCLEEIPELIQFQAKYPQIQLLGIHAEAIDQAQLQPLLQRFAFNYPLLVIGELPITPIEPLQGLPTTAIINPQGELVSKQTGPVSAALLQAFFQREGVIAP
jgi:thiol-disulfide isomerase/thioredoxin